MGWSNRQTLPLFIQAHTSNTTPPHLPVSSPLLLYFRQCRPANGIPQRFRRTKDGRVLRLSYDGGWRADLKHGLGVLYMANGDVYEGEWEAGARSGWGVCLYASGERYEGEWVAGLREGQGKYFYANGNIHEGMWAADMKDGPGKLYYAARSQLYEGEWFEDAVRCGVVVDLEPEDPSRIDLPLVGIANETMVSLLQDRIDEIKEARLDRAEAAATARSDAMRTAAETRRIQVPWRRRCLSELGVRGKGKRAGVGVGWRSGACSVARAGQVLGA